MADEGHIIIVNPDADLARYADAEHVRRPHGVIWVNGQEVAQTLQCCHCGGHFVPRKGSRTRRGFCMKCEAVTCGSADCVECRPWVAEFGQNFGREF